MALTGKRRLWALWGLASVLLAGYLAAGLLAQAAPALPWLDSARRAALPGATSHGHYQIELKCNACHGKAFEGGEAIQNACMDCHGAELKEADDSHPKSKFTDPRNAERVAKLDATRCVACHVEHRPGITGPMAVTLPADFCAYCHQDIADERPSHKDMAFDSCGNAGCHNFHDNRALYEDWLLKHQDEPAVTAKPLVRERDFATVLEELPTYPIKRYPVKALAAAEHDAPRGQDQPAAVAEWAASAHAKSGVNCSACHRPGAGKPGEGDWVERPAPAACAACHGPEAKGFQAGRHGMRVAQGLPPMSPLLARIPMKSDAHDKRLDCATCHAAHKPDTRKAAAESCLECHADGHSKAWEGSAHQRLWKAEVAGEGPAGSGVSCATCHLPRGVLRADETVRTLVQHNQNDNLRPNEKMIRSVCQGCHGQGFSMDALADAKLVANNFKGKPATHNPSLKMAQERHEQELAKKAKRKQRAADRAAHKGDG